MFYRKADGDKVDVKSGTTKVPAGSTVIFNVVNNAPAKYTFGPSNWTHTGVPTGAWKTEAASPTRAELTMPDADVTVTATLQEKLPPAKIATLKIKSAANEVLFEADAELLKKALNTYTQPADIVLPFGTENCKFEVVTNPQGANVAYTPSDLGTTGHKFTSTATNVDLVVGTDSVHTKSTYKFKVKTEDKPETKLKSITINGTKLTNDEMKLAAENNLIKLVSSPCKINWEADTGIEVSADNGVQKDTTFAVTTTEWKKVVITIKNTLKNNETKKYTVKLRKEIGDGKPELKDISVSGVAITLADLEKALEESTAPVIEIEKPADGSGASVSISWTDEDDDNFKVKAAKKLGNGVYGGNKDVSEDGSYDVEMPKPDEATKLPVTVKITITFGGKSRMYYVKLKYKA